MNLFTYGTLMDPAIWNRVAGEPGVTQRALLTGYEARRLRGELFPGLVKSRGARLQGLLYSGVSDVAMKRLDEYEGDLYNRVEVTVETENGPPVRAQIYLTHPDHRDAVLDEIWQPPAVSGPSRT
jgi:gamma-glutamylcyclotransferase (GGCT)/AIG2-like uncharacterized protein YtfP